MNEKLKLSGPFYVELAYEAAGFAGSEQIQTAYIDGIASEEEAWAACDGIREDSIDAITDNGAHIEIHPAQLLQALIGKTALEGARAGK